MRTIFSTTDFYMVTHLIFNHPLVEEKVSLIIPNPTEQQTKD